MSIGSEPAIISAAQQTRSALFEPMRLGPLHLPNRIVMAPLTRSRLVAPSLERSTLS